MYFRSINLAAGQAKPVEASASAQRRAWVNELGWTAVIWLVACTVRLIRLDHTPQWDEMYHFLAGQSWLHHGTFAIADGQYLRAPLFTIIVAEFMRWFGTSLVVARMPSVLAGSLAVALLYRFTAAQAGRKAGLFAAGILCFYPLAIYLGQYARFYALHGLCFWVGAYAFFRLAQELKFNRQAVLWAGLSLACLVLAYQFQVTTLVGVGALVIWLGLRVTWFWFRRLILGEWQAAWVLGASAAAAAVGFLIAWRVGFVTFLLKTFFHAPVWAEGLVTDSSFYYHWMSAEIPLLWACFPLAGLLALRRRPAFAFFCITVFAVIFITHSLAADKADRYIFYGLPFFFAVWGVALSAIVPEIMRVLRELINALFSSQFPEGVLRNVTRLGGAALAGMILLLNPATTMTYRMLCYPDAKWKIPQHYRGFADWGAAARILKPLAEQSDALVTSCSVKSLYFLGRCGYEISVTGLHETDTGKQFGVDPRTGHPVISSAGALAAIMRKHRTGLIVVEQARWRVPVDVPDGVADYIEAHTQPVSLPKEWRLLAFRWQH